jgi:hypothetical protein
MPALVWIFNFRFVTGNNQDIAGAIVHTGFTKIAFLAENWRHNDLPIVIYLCKVDYL